MTRPIITIGVAAFEALAGSAHSQSFLQWTDGVGMQLCSQLASVGDDALMPWVQGYWTGANLYLGGTDLCLERAVIPDIPLQNIRPLLEVHCAPYPDAPIMVAAFNALKGLPTVHGSRTAGCEGN